MKQYKNETATSKKSKIEDVCNQNHQPQQESRKYELTRLKTHHENEINLMRKEIEMLQKHKKIILKKWKKRSGQDRPK